MIRWSAPLAVEVVLAALLWVVLSVGSSVLALTVPVYTSAMTQALGVPASSGLSASDVIHLSGEVRAFVADASYDPLPATWRGAPAFDAAAVSHLQDVRSVISVARLASGAAALLLAVYVAFGIARRRFTRLRSGMHAAAWALVAAVGLAAVAGLLDFDTLFSSFHSLFFASGTWTFPADSMLIRLFPEPFWIASGACWAALVLLFAGLLALAGKRFVPALESMGASRMAENV
jgi:integral membrane protein (TIGR01906 family)